MKQLTKKLVEVMSAVQKVKKTGWNDYQKYEYMTEADLLGAVREELSKRNVFVATSVEHVSKEGELVTVTTKHTFIDADSGESLSVNGAGVGHDKLDKAIYKAQTGAMKYFVMKNFLVSSDDDPENDSKEKPKTKVENVGPVPKGPAFPVTTPKTAFPASKPVPPTLPKAEVVEAPVAAPAAPVAAAPSLPQATTSNFRSFKTNK